MQQAGALLILCVGLYIALRDGFSSTVTGAATAPAQPPSPTAFPAGITVLAAATSDAIPAFKALAPPHLSISFCTS